MVTICTICFNIKTFGISLILYTGYTGRGTGHTSGNDPKVKLHCYKHYYIRSWNNYRDNDETGFKVLQILSMYLLLNALK
jgi:hypothetical protein